MRWRPSSAKPGVLVKVIVRVTRPENGDATIPRSVGFGLRPRAGFWARAGGDGQTEEIPDKAGWPRMPSGSEEGSRLLGVTLLVRNEWAWLWALPTFNRQNTESHREVGTLLTDIVLI